MDLMQDLRRTCYCGEVTKAGETVVVGGFVQKVRNLGNLIFIDLRDRTGIVQLAFNDQTDRAIFEKAASCHSEYVLLAKGVVAERSSINKDMKTGAVEVLVDDLRVLSKAQTPPFAITDETKTNEELRLKYRYLDLRRAPLQHNLMMRHKIALAAREYFYANNFIEIETPMMMKSTPEGARDYLIPSRVHNGKFYALPQSPQIYKQLLMVAGMDRYIQIARCFRDEDLRADRQPDRPGNVLCGRRRYSPADRGLCEVSVPESPAHGYYHTPAPHDLSGSHGTLRFRQAGYPLRHGIAGSV